MDRHLYNTKILEKIEAIQRNAETIDEEQCHRGTAWSCLKVLAITLFTYAEYDTFGDEENTV